VQFTHAVLRSPGLYREVCLLKRPFLLQQLILRPALDTLQRDDVGASIHPADPDEHGRIRARRFNSTSRCDINCRSYNAPGRGESGSRTRTGGSGPASRASGPDGAQPS
jgi:hypothetical protein